MDAEAALADLTEISSQIESAVVFAEDGSVLASTFESAERANGLAATARELFDAARQLQRGERELAQLEVSLREGGVYVVRDGGRAIAATAASGSPAGLVLYDLRACLRAIEDAVEPPKRSSRRRARTTAPADA
jgi:predicted regulator of Ras-like GTPase activity (Roadblock/LC7/MglB family)